MKIKHLATIAAWLCLGVPALAAEAPYPSKPIRLIVPFARGGTTDIIARVIADKAAPAIGQPIAVENRPGAGGSAGAKELASAAADGYTLGMATVSTVATNPAINPKTEYDPLADFTPITNVAVTPNVILVHPSFPAKDYSGFIAEIRRSPGKYSYATAGQGSIGHLQMELYKSLTKTFITHIPYKGSGPGLADTAAGRVPIMFDNLPSALPYIGDGRLIAVAVAAPARVAALPDVPTLAEVGLPVANRTAFYGLCGPTPRPGA